MVEKMNLGVIFGGRSGEHEVSLMSARSVLSALNPEKYAVTQIGITHAGEWLVGKGGNHLDVLGALESGNVSDLVQAAILPDPTRRGLYTIQPGDKNGLER